ncbi:hypothetical protein ACFCT7_13675 [Fulvivirgaceae bacterium LMO-SS25]
MTTKGKRRIQNLILTIFSVSFSLVIAEIALRLLYQENSNVLIKEWQSGPYLYDNEYWKVWHYPNTTITHQRDCFEVTYQTNSLGLRGDEIDENKPNIALLGDSFIEGYGVNNHETAVEILDSLVEDYNVLNFGTSGGFGTVHQVAQYENFARHLNPDIVVLFFLNYNDLYDNALAISEGLLNKDTEFTYPIAKDFEIVREGIKSQTSGEFIPNTIQGLYVAGAIDKGINSLTAQLQIAVNSKLFDFNRRLAETYLPTETEEIQIGYDILEKSLSRLKYLTEQDSANLVLVQIADPYQIDENWLELMQYKFEEKIDPLLPNKKVAAICQELGIDYLSMYEAAMEEIQDEDLGFPYFSYSCNRHFSPIGQRFMAEWFHSQIDDVDFDFPIDASLE